MIVYGYFINWCTYESAEGLHSLHDTKAGAWRALRAFKWDQAVGSRETHLRYGGCADDYRERDWTTHRVRELEVQCEGVADGQAEVPG